MLPSVTEAERLLREGEAMNPGPWGAHSRTAAYCARRLAQACGDLDPEKAWILGLLHDIGRRFGVTYLRHAMDGYVFLSDLGYDEAARVCLTHSFERGEMDDYVGRWDVAEEEAAWILKKLKDMQMDDYDRLIQLCDAVSGPGYVMGIEERMEDVRRRHGRYPRTKWEANLKLKEDLEKRMGRALESVLVPGTRTETV